MKGLKKLALASAVAAAPFAQAELVAVDDALLGEMTGQDGVSIELETRVTIDSVTWTDGDGFGASATQGTVGINGIALGGAAAGSALDDILIEIDADGSDGLLIHLGGTNSQEVLMNVDANTNGSVESVDFGLDVASFDVNGSVIASAIAIDGRLGPIDIQIKDNGAADATIDVNAFFQVTAGSMYIDVMGVGISNLTVGDNDNPFMASSYGAQVNAAIGSQEYTAPDAIAAADDVANGGNGDGIVQVSEQDAAAAAAGAAPAGAVIEGARLAAGYTGMDGMAQVAMTISTADASYTNALGQTSTNLDALNVNITAMNMDIAMDVSIGGSSIGNVAIDNLNLTGTNLKIYGH
jgi:hypothetical protein